MTKEQRDLRLFKVMHKLIVIEQDGEYQIIPIVKSVGFTTWTLRHKFKFNVVANIQGRHEDILNIADPYSCHTDLGDLKEICDKNELRFTYISNPPVPDCLPTALLSSEEAHLRYFTEDGAALLLSEDLSREGITTYYLKLINKISKELHTVVVHKGFTYFDAYATQLSLLGGIKDNLSPYPNTQGSSSKTQTLYSILNKNKKAVQLYIKRYTNDIKASVVVKASRPYATIVPTGEEFTLPTAVREMYESQIAPYIANIKKG